MPESTATETDPSKIDLGKETDPVEKVDEVKEVLKEIRDHVRPKETVVVGPTREELRNKIKESTGFTDEQLDFHERSVAAANAPLQEKLAWSDLKEEVGGIEPEIKEAMDLELKKYSPIQRADKTLLEKVYFMSVGRLAKKNPVRREVAEYENQGAEEKEVISRRIVTEHRGSTVSVGSNSGSSKVKLTEDEKRIARRYGMPDEEYAKFKNNDPIESFRKK